MAPRFSSKSNNTKTWFLMLGIAAIVAVDLGFTVLVGSENTPSLALDTPVARPRATAPTRISPEPVKPETSQNTAVSELPAKDVSAPRPRINMPRTDAAQVIPHQVLVAAVQKQDRPIAPTRQKQFSPKIVRPQYAAKMPLAFGPYVVTTSDNISVAAAEAKRPRNNSLASKFSPVVKKPWQWMKALVSKLR